MDGVWRGRDVPAETTRRNQGERQYSRGCDHRGAEWEERIKPVRRVGRCLIITGSEYLSETSLPNSLLGSLCSY